MSILQVEGLKKVYTSRFGANKVEALRNVNFSVEEGEYVAVMGESGSGKTTLLNILAALDKPTAGSVLLDGKNLADVRESEISAFRRDHLGFVFQEFNLLDTFTLEDNIYLPMVLAGKPYADMRTRLIPIARHLGILRTAQKIPLRGLGRPETARRRRPRADYETAPDPRRRTDRRARFPRDGRTAPALRRNQPRRADHHHGHPFGQGRQPRRGACCSSRTAKCSISSIAARIRTSSFISASPIRSPCSRRAVTGSENRLLRKARRNRHAQKQTALSPLSAHLRVHGHDVLYRRVSGHLARSRRNEGRRFRAGHARHGHDGHSRFLGAVSVLYQFVPHAPPQARVRAV